MNQTTYDCFLLCSETSISSLYSLFDLFRKTIMLCQSFYSIIAELFHQTVCSVKPDLKCFFNDINEEYLIGNESYNEVDFIELNNSFPFEFRNNNREQEADQDNETEENFIDTIQFGDAVNAEELIRFKELVLEFKEIFVSSSKAIPPPMKCKPVDIDPGNIKPVCLKTRHVSMEVLAKLQRKLRMV